VFAAIIRWRFFVKVLLLPILNRAGGATDAASIRSC
jgi:hypothetical protein